MRSPDALRRIVTAPGELGLARAYVAGDIDFEGDIFAALEVRQPLRGRPHRLARGARHPAHRSGPSVLRPLPPPPEEMKPRGRLHSISRDATAVSHHYDVSNEFYELLLGPTMTYSCAVWDDPDALRPDGTPDPAGLDAAQRPSTS